MTLCDSTDLIFYKIKYNFCKYFVQETLIKFNIDHK